MAKLINLLNYPMHPGFQRHLQRTLALYYCLDRFKRCNLHQKTAFKNLFLGLYQKGFLVDTSKLEKRFKTNEICSNFIPVDGPADEQQVQAVIKLLPACCKGMLREDLLYICSLLDETKQIYEIPLDYSINVPPMPQHSVNWKYGLTSYEHNITICPVTARPLSTLNDKTWSRNAKDIFGFSANSQLFKGCKYMEQFIMKYKKQPTRDELAIFYYNRYVVTDGRVTLPFLTEKWIDQLLVAYRVVFVEGFEIKNIVAALKESRVVERRVELEAQ